MEENFYPRLTEEDQEQLKEKKTEAKELMAAKEAEDQKKIMDALKTSGKTLEEVLAFLTETEESAEEAAETGENTEE